MKKYLVLIPILIVLASVIGFYVNKNAEIKEAQHQLSSLKELSHELEILFKNHMRTMEDAGLSADVDDIAQSSKEINLYTDRYIDRLNSMQYDRLYRLGKNIRIKTDALKNVYEDIKTDQAIVSSSKIWAINNFESYIKASNSLTYENRAYLNYLLKASINNSYKGLVNIKNVKYADALNLNLVMIQKKELSLSKSYEIMRKNDISNDLNEIVIFTFKTLDELRNETDSIIKKLLIVSTLMLLFALGMYARTINSLAETSRLKNELSEFVHALDESAIVSKSDLNGNITYVNDMFCKVTGYERSQLIGKSHSIVRHPDMPVGLFKRLWTTIKANKIFKGTIKNKAKDGSVYYVDTTIVPLHNENGKIDEYLSVRYDVTNFYKDFSSTEDKRQGNRGL
jgi:PAS domain S-box-containing protein